MAVGDPGQVKKKCCKYLPRPVHLKASYAENKLETDRREQADKIQVKITQKSVLHSVSKQCI